MNFKCFNGTWVRHNGSPAGAVIPAQSDGAVKRANAPQEPPIRPPGSVESTAIDAPPSLTGPTSLASPPGTPSSGGSADSFRFAAPLSLAIPPLEGVNPDAGSGLGPEGTIGRGTDDTPPPTEEPQGGGAGWNRRRSCRAHFPTVDPEGIRQGPRGWVELSGEEHQARQGVRANDRPQPASAMAWSGSPRMESFSFSSTT